MAGNTVNKNVDITLNIKKGTFEGISDVGKALEGVLANLSILKGLELPNLTAFVKDFKSLAATTIDNAKFEKFTQNLTNLSGVSSANISSIANVLAPFQGITFPPLDQFVSALRSLDKDVNSGKIANNMGLLTTELQKLSTVQLPNTAGFLQGFKDLSQVNPNSKGINDLATSLTKLTGLQLPDLTTLIVGLKDFGKIKGLDVITQNLKTLSTALKGFSTITLPNLGSIATALTKIGKIDVSVVVPKIQNLIAALQGFNGISVPNLSKIPTMLERLNKVDVSNVDVVIKKLYDLVAVFQTLSNNATVINALAVLTRSLSTLQTQSAQTAQAATGLGGALGGLLSKAGGYAMFKLVADSVRLIETALFAGIRATIDYDQSLKNLKAITGATALETEKMGDVIRRVSQDTQFSTKEVADGMTILGQAGLTAKQSIQSIDAIISLATATGTSIATVVDLVTTTFSVYGMEANRATYISDVFANSVNKSKLSMEGLATAFNYVGPIAATAGVSFEDTNAALMTLANAGLRASTQGTVLRQVMAALEDPNQKLADAATKAGVSLQDLDLNTHSLSSVFNTLRTMMVDVKTGMIDNTRVFSTFEKRTASGLVSLLQTNQAGLLVFDGMRDSLLESGTAADMQKIQMEGLDNSIKKLWNSILTTSINLGENGGLTSVFRVLIKVAQQLSDSINYLVQNGFAQFLSNMALLVGVAGAAVFAIGGFSTAIFSAIGGMTTAGLGVRTFAAVFSLLTTNIAVSITAMKSFAIATAVFMKTPAGLALTALTALVAGYTYFAGASQRAASASKTYKDELDKQSDSLQNLGSDLDLYQKKLDSIRNSPGTDASKLAQEKSLLNEILKTHSEISGEIKNEYIASVNVQKVLADISSYKIKQQHLVDVKKLEEDAKGVKELQKQLDILEKKKQEARSATAGEGISLVDVAKNAKETLQVQNNIDSMVSHIAVSVMRLNDAGGEAIDWPKILGMETFRRVMQQIDDWSVKSASKGSFATNLTPKQINDEYEANRQALIREEDKKLLALDKARSTDFKNSEKYDRDKLQVQVSAAKTRAEAANEAFLAVSSQKNIDVSPEELEKAKKNLHEAEVQLNDFRLKSAEKQYNIKKAATDKLSDLQNRANEEELKSLNDYNSTVETYNSNNVAAHKSYLDSIRGLQETTKNKLEKIEQDYNNKSSDLARAKDAADIKRIQDTQSREIAAADKLQEIRLRGIPEEYLQDNKAATADAKLAKGIEMLNRARAEGNAAALESANKVISQAEEMYSSLADSNAAVSGIARVGEAQQALIDATKDVEYFNTDVQEAKAKRHYDQEKIRVYDLQDEKLALIMDEYVTKLRDNFDITQKELDSEENRHTKKVRNLARERDIQSGRISDAEVKQDITLLTNTSKPLINPDSVGAGSLDASGNLLLPVRMELKDEASTIARLDKQLVVLRDRIANSSSTMSEDTTKEYMNRRIEELKIEYGLTDEKLANSKTQVTTLRSNLQIFNDEFGKQLLNLGSGAFTSLVGETASFFDTIITGSGSASDALRTMGINFVKSLSGMISQLLAYKVIATAVSFIPGGFAIPAFGGVGRATGGPVYGPGSGTSDSISARLSNGEYVMTAAQTKQWLPVLEIMRQGKFGAWLNGLNVSSIAPRIPSIAHYAGGGLATGSTKIENAGANNVNMVFNITDSGVASASVDSGGASPNIQQFGKMMQNMVTAQLVKEKRPGGLLYGS